MGAWGAGLYSDDTACEVRDRYVELLREGRAANTVAAAVLKEYRDVLDDRDVDCLVTFALADTAWKHGRLTETLRRRALKLLASGGDLSVWERDHPKAVGARRKALESLRERLESPQPPPKAMRPSRPRPPRRRLLEARLGEVFLMPMPNGDFVPLVYLGETEMERTIDPYFMIPAWRERRRPTETEVRAATKDPVRIPSGLPVDHRLFGFMPLFEQRKGPHPASLLERTAIVLDPPPKAPDRTPVFRGYEGAPTSLLDRLLPARDDSCTR